jgi:ATP-dependent protease HslVU (ClpYQ) peptidase subunit
MTILVALRDAARGEVWIGADSRAVSDRFIWPHGAQKILRVGEWRLGIAGTAMTARLIKDNAAVLAAMETAESIWDFIRDEYKRLEFKADDAFGPRDYHQDMIAATASTVFHCAGNGVVAEMDFAAIGSGDEFAYGAWHALRGLTLAPHGIVHAALEAACFFDAGCGGELVVERVE